MVTALNLAFVVLLLGSSPQASASVVHVQYEGIEGVSTATTVGDVGVFPVLV